MHGESFEPDVAGEGYLLQEAVHKLHALGVKITPRQLRLWDKLINPETDESNYRRFTYQDLEHVVVVFVLNKVLRLSLTRIKNLMVCLQSERELRALVERHAPSVMEKAKDARGKEGWMLRRDLRGDLTAMDETLRKFQEGLRRCEEILREGRVRLLKVAADAVVTRDP